MNISKKILSILVISFLVAASGCAAAEKYKIVDTRDGTKGKNPKWLKQSMSKLEAEYPGKYAFVIRNSGENLAFIENWSKRVSAGAEVAALISQQVTDLTAASQYGTDANFQQTMETLSTSMSKAKIVGLRREDDWWRLKQYTSGDRKGKREYEYMVLFLVDKQNIDGLIQNELQKALNGANAQTKARVEEAMDSLILESGGDIE